MTPDQNAGDVPDRKRAKRRALALDQPPDGRTSAQDFSQKSEIYSHSEQTDGHETSY